MAVDPQAYIKARIEVNSATGCWEWQRHRHVRTGYGRLGFSDGDHYAHRFSYEAFVGPIPAGLHLDHLCRVRHCVNPDHLEPVTQRENNLRSESLPSLNARKTHCKNGHPFAGENLRISRDGYRRCRECHRITQRRQYWHKAKSKEVA